MYFDDRLVSWIIKILVCWCLVATATVKCSWIDKEIIGKSPFELDEILNVTYPMYGFNGTWIGGSEFIYGNTDGDVMKFDLVTKATTLFLKGEVLEVYQPATITVSHDLSYILIRYNESAVFRHSTTAVFTIYDMNTGAYYDIAQKKPLQLATFAPQGHGLVYVFENNIYYLDDFSVDVNNPTTVTNIGVPGILYCGVPDWVYEEEVLASGSALWFSPSGRFLAYAVFDDRDVESYFYVIYGEPGALTSQYPKNPRIKYPKVGTKNPKVIIYLYDVTTKQTLEFQLPLTIDNKKRNDYIFFDLKWISDSEVAMLSTNRIQNESLVLRCQISGECHEESYYVEKYGWLEPIIPTYSKDGKKRLDILPQPVDNDRYNHLVMTDLRTNSLTRWTFGKSVVTSILGWDEDAGVIYYIATVEDTPSQQHVYAVNMEAQQQCLTCDMEIDGKKCTYGIGQLSKDNSYYVKLCRGPGPALTIIENTRNASDLVLWQDNSELKVALASKLFPTIKNLIVPINDAFNARVRLLLPPNLDEQSSKKYPAIINVYGGPNQNQINDAFGVKFENYLTTKKEYIYVFIDGRGTGRDGLNKLFQVYKRFGTVEIEDQINTMKYLLETLPYIDENRVGIWGWSYGGFAASWALAKDSDHIFNFALAVAPVTSFIYYDSIYTERYMGLPTVEDNEAGYNATDLTRVVEAFRGRRYFIIHGNADDNVHYQNSQLLVKALEYADIDFRQQNYPDEQHGLTHVSRHLYHTIDKYWTRCFGVDGPSITSFNNKTS